ncbi:MAG TPA: hypothetical protein VJ914_12725 [Pseudonocardiaceae bacterium]|nr:hypothetical protein [Pseudonocardiaceae bacterium]
MPASFPWQEHRYKYGRWQRVGALFNLGIERYKWSKTFDTFQLVDRASGRALGECLAAGTKLAKYDGTVWFAGDPAIAGVCSPTPDDAAPNWLVISAFADQRAVIEQLDQLRPGTALWLPPGPTGRVADTPEAPWVADHPDKPRKQ